MEILIIVKSRRKLIVAINGQLNLYEKCQIIFKYPCYYGIPRVPEFCCDRVSSAVRFQSV
jgi:hypothetical protein